MKFVVVAAVSVGVIAGPWTARGADAPRTVTGPAVSAAVDKAAKFLLSAQVGDNWEGSPTIEIYKQQVTGWTALAVDALLSAGVNSRDPGIDKAVKYLKSHQTDGIYALGLRMQVWQRLPPAPDVRAAARADLAKILANVGTKGDAAGMFTYYGPTKTAYSHSRTQYAIQGAAAARAMGLEVPETFWKATEAAWVDHQSADGGWTYTKANANGYPETAGMTTVALASLLLAHDALRQDETADCRGTVPDPAITKGLAWMSAHTDDLANDAKTPRAYPYYTLYGAERLGAAGGVKYFGSVNWYGKGAAWLLGDQGADGNWGSKTYTIDGSPAAFLDTCFALLFLARGRVPLFMQKLDYTPASAMVPAKGSTQLPRTEWNQRPRDASNLAAFAGRSLEQEFAWQRIPLSAPVADFHDAPILYLEGRDAVTFDAAAIAKFKAFLHQQTEAVLLRGAQEQADEPVVEHVQERRDAAVAQAVRPLHQLGIHLRQHAQRPGQAQERHPQAQAVRVRHGAGHRRRREGQALDHRQAQRLLVRRGVGAGAAVAELGQAQSVQAVEAVRHRAQAGAERQRVQARGAWGASAHSSGRSPARGGKVHSASSRPCRRTVRRVKLLIEA